MVEAEELAKLTQAFESAFQRGKLAPDANIIDLGLCRLVAMTCLVGTAICQRLDEVLARMPKPEPPPPAETEH